ncbi:hypothetical protein BC829DRAFT_436723 [Chytridium lagenaria]|nr:hypothetical protein BC829DRAFT_436723 [Chytridium lagenaria]
MPIATSKPRVPGIDTTSHERDGEEPESFSYFLKFIYSFVSISNVTIKTARERSMVDFPPNVYGDFAEKNSVDIDSEMPRRDFEANGCHEVTTKTRREEYSIPILFSIALMPTTTTSLAFSKKFTNGADWKERFFFMDSFDIDSEIPRRDFETTDATRLRRRPDGEEPSISFSFFFNSFDADINEKVSYDRGNGQHEVTNEARRSKNLLEELPIPIPFSSKALMTT